MTTKSRVKQVPVRLSDTHISKLKPQLEEYWVTEGHGFGIRVYPSGVKSFIYLYNFQGRSRRLTLGKYPALPLNMARSLAAKAREHLDVGIDPAAEFEKSSKSVAGAMTVSDLMNIFIDTHLLKLSPKTRRDYESAINLHILPAWKYKLVKDIEEAEADELFKKIISKGGGDSANRVKAIISTAWRIAKKEKEIKYFPFDGMAKPVASTSGKRVLNVPEISLFWHGLPRVIKQARTRNALKLILLLGRRETEVCGMEWDEVEIGTIKWRDAAMHDFKNVDMDEAIWLLPARRVDPTDSTQLISSGSKKSERKAASAVDIAIPLPSLAIKILMEEWRLYGRTNYVFAGKDRSRPITSAALSRAVGKGWGLMGFKDKFKPSDLRRTTSTNMARIGIIQETIDKVLAHTSGGVRGVYNVYTYLPEKRAALRQWNDEIKRIISVHPAIQLTLSKPKPKSGQFKKGDPRIRRGG